MLQLKRSLAHKGLRPRSASPPPLHHTNLGLAAGLGGGIFALTADRLPKRRKRLSKMKICTNEAMKPTVLNARASKILRSVSFQRTTATTGVAALSPISAVKIRSTK